MLYMMYILYAYSLVNLCLNCYSINRLLREMTLEDYTFRFVYYSFMLYLCELYFEYPYQVAYYSFIFFYFLWIRIYLHL